MLDLQADFFAYRGMPPSPNKRVTGQSAGGFEPQARMGAGSCCSALGTKSLFAFAYFAYVGSRVS